MRVEVTVDELVLRGVPRERAHAVAAALEARLAVLAEQWAAADAAPAPRDEAFRRLPAVEVRDGDPAALGESVADEVWAAVVRRRRGGRR
jgi:hypothetical protein